MCVRERVRVCVCVCLSIRDILIDTSVHLSLLASFMISMKKVMISYKLSVNHLNRIKDKLGKRDVSTLLINLLKEMPVYNTPVDLHYVA